jgi:hypothetical protein
MIKLAYIADFQGKIPDQALLLEDDRGYVEACCRIRDALEGMSDDVLVWVRSRHHYAWLSHYVEQMGLGASCEREEMTPCRILAESWNVILPGWMDDGTVVAQKLLDLDVPESHPVDFSDCLLSALVSPVFESSTLSLPDSGGLIQAWLRAEQKGVVSQYPVLNQALREKCRMWEKAKDETWVRYVCGRLQDAPEDLWGELTAWCLLGRYPAKALEFVLEPHRAAAVRSVPLNPLEALPLHQECRGKCIEQMRVVFEDIGPSITSSDEFSTLLGCCSGRLVEEFDLVRSILTSGTFSPNDKDVAQTVQRFAACPQVTKAKVRALEVIVAPPVPSEPAAGEDLPPAAWVGWSVGEYFQYRRWQEKSGQYHERLEKDVCRFSDWYVNNYVTVQKNEKWGLVHVLGAWSDQIDDDDIALLMIVDCVPVVYWGLLDSVLTGGGFHRHSQAYRFAPLPSHTAASKPNIIAGTWMPGSADYTKLVEGRVGKDWPERKALYVPSLSALAGLTVPDGPVLMVVNYTFSDKTLHGDPGKMGSTYEDELEGLFSKLAGALQDFRAGLGEDRQLSLYTVTDHGATLPLAEERKTVSSSVAGKLFDDPEHRFARMNADQADKVPQNLWDLGYKFTPPFGDATEVFFIPRGHNTVKVSAAEGYVHGGATPEEVIVPVAVYRTVEAPLKPLAMRLLDLRYEGPDHHAVFYVKRLVPIELELQNPNSEPAQIEGVEVDGVEVEVKSGDTGVVEANGTQRVTFHCYFSTGPSEAAVPVTFRVKCTIAGQGLVSEQKIPAEFRSAVKKKTFDLTDLIS